MKHFLAALLLLSLASSAQAATTHNSVDLQWTAVGDDSLTGQATEYDIRFATFPITEANFSTATRWLGPPVKVPGAPLSVETLTIAGLLPLTQYWFAVKTADEVPNWAGISNVATRTTLAVPDTIRPAPITDLAAP